jgi:integral membrane protein
MHAFRLSRFMTRVAKHLPYNKRQAYPGIMNNIFKKTFGIQFFTEREAWSVFRLAAIGEAVGWTLLISGILIARYATPGNNDAVLIAGQLHGTLFLIYLAAVVAVCGSLRWSPHFTLLAGLVSVPPYGTLIFEQWLAHRRRQEALKSHRQVTVRAIIVNRGKLLAVQPKEDVFWCLPGGSLLPGESVEQALLRTVAEQTGIMPKLDHLQYVFQYQHRKTPRLELFFGVSNAKDYDSIGMQWAKQKHPEIDEITFVKPTNSDLLPTFLQTEPLSNNTAKKVRFIQEEGQAPYRFV